MQVLGWGRENSRTSIFRCAPGRPPSSYRYPSQPPTAGQKLDERSICDARKITSGMYMISTIFDGSS